MHPPTPSKKVLSGFIERTRRLYVEMDRDYRLSADACGFACNGCEDNCCRTLFYHHTYLEYLALRDGFAGLSKELRESSLSRAADYLRAVSVDGRPAGQRPICPINRAGRCMLYAVRPMICRLHGIEHVLRAPGRPPRLGPGCAEFYRHCGPRARRRLDRTPHYLKLAELESRFKQAVGVRRKLKLTLADMLLNDWLEGRDGDRTPPDARGR